jgi:hypothetical protein
MAIASKNLHELGSDQAAASDHHDLHHFSPVCRPPIGLVIGECLPAGRKILQWP